jgi:hypothetical protein
MSERFDELRTRLLGLEGELLQVLSGVRHALDAADEENRHLRDEAVMTHIEVYTEPEAAEKLRMSQDLLSRLRVEEDLPHFRAGVLVRYTNRHVAEIAEMLTKRGRGNKRRAARAA